MNKYPGLYNYPNNPYGNAVVMDDLIEQSWIKDNLVASQESWNEDCNGQAYLAGMITGYCLSTTNEGHRFYSFHDPENKRRVLERLAHRVIDPNPVLADEPAPDPKKYSNVAGPRIDWFWTWLSIALAVGILIGMTR